jgi:selenide, water dikinase
VVVGLAPLANIKSNDSAQAGDRLIFSKPLGIGILSAALKQGKLDDQGYAEMLAATRQLNRIGAQLGGLPGVHAMTDVTGFGLLGHLLEICRGSALAARIDFATIPRFALAQSFLEQGIGPGAIERNWASYGAEVNLDSNLPGWAQRLLCDPQTSGGLMVACAPKAVDEVLGRFHAEGFGSAATIGLLEAGPARAWIR